MLKFARKRRPDYVIAMVQLHLNSGFEVSKTIFTSTTGEATFERDLGLTDSFFWEDETSVQSSSLWSKQFPALMQGQSKPGIETAQRIGIEALTAIPEPHIRAEITKFLASPETNISIDLRTIDDLKFL